MSNGLNYSCRIRRTPYTDCVEASGVTGFSVVNHMLLPKSYLHSVESDYWHLRTNVQVWDVSCQRQIEIKGSDAKRLTQLMCPRDISKMAYGRCFYAPLIDSNACILNDPIIFKLDDDHYRLSISDSDVLLYAKGIANALRLNVQLDEVDIAPLAIQGPHSEEVLVALFGDRIKQLQYFDWGWFEFGRKRHIVSRTGYSSQDGFEIYLEGNDLGTELWETVCNAGEKYNIRPGCPNLIDRIEAGYLSYGNDLTYNTNPIEAGLKRFCSLDSEIKYFGKDALLDIYASGTKRLMRGIVFGSQPCPICSIPWPVSLGDSIIGFVRSAIWSPRINQNVGLGLMNRDVEMHHANLTLISQNSNLHKARLSSMPII